MIVAFACIRTSIMCKCSKIGITPDSARNAKSQHSHCDYRNSAPILQHQVTFQGHMIIVYVQEHLRKVEPNNNVHPYHG